MRGTMRISCWLLMAAKIPARLPSYLRMALCLRDWLLLLRNSCSRRFSRSHFRTLSPLGVALIPMIAAALLGNETRGLLVARVCASLRRGLLDDNPRMQRPRIAGKSTNDTRGTRRPCASSVSYLMEIVRGSALGLGRRFGAMVHKRKIVVYILRAPTVLLPGLTAPRYECVL